MELAKKTDPKVVSPSKTISSSTPNSGNKTTFSSSPVQTKTVIKPAPAMNIQSAQQDMKKKMMEAQKPV